MSTVFIGGSRRVSCLPKEAKHWLDDWVEENCSVLVGDANGADKVLQKYLYDRHYDHVTVYCSGKFCRNNIGEWNTRCVDVSGSKRDFQFYTAKDREMADKAEVGLMIWDGESPGTFRNVLHLAGASKKAILIWPKNQVYTLENENGLNSFIQELPISLRENLEQKLQTEWPSSLSKQEELELT